MELKSGYWLCKACHIQVPIKRLKLKVGYCAICGRFSQRLYDYQVIGLCDRCAMEALKAVGRSMDIANENILKKVLREYRESP